MTGAIILAAGSSSRMGQSKQMLEIHGKKLILKTIDAVVEGGVNSIVVVLGAQEKAHREILRKAPVDIAFNADWEKGMGTSIKIGLRRLLVKYPRVESVIILVCDQPLLNGKIISGLVKEYHRYGRPIVASRYSDVPGVPVLFSKKYFGELSILPDDQGAKKLIVMNPEDVAVIPFPGGEIDLDTMEDYESFLQRT